MATETFLKRALSPLLLFMPAAGDLATSTVPLLAGRADLQGRAVAVLFHHAGVATIHQSAQHLRRWRRRRVTNSSEHAPTALELWASGLG